MWTDLLAQWTRRLLWIAAVLSVFACGTTPQKPVLVPSAGARAPSYERAETRALASLVNDATKLLRGKGEAAFVEFRQPGSRWRQGESYIFVLDPLGNMLVHPDSALEGKNQLALEDVQGKRIIRGLIDAATMVPSKPHGWYHYQWFAPGELLPRWKSSYVELVTLPSGKTYVLGSGMYDDRMDKELVVDMVNDAVGLIEKDGRSAFALLRDPKGRFMAKDTYVFVVDPSGVELVNPGFRNIEGRNVIELKDANGKPLVREMLDVAKRRGAGWVEYMWPKPGESVPTQKSTYVKRAKIGDGWLLVACGVYLSDAPKASVTAKKLDATALMGLVGDAALVLGQKGEGAYPELRQRGSKWFRDDTYLFVWNSEGVRTFHAADPGLEGRRADAIEDVLGRPYGKMFLEVAASPAGEGWVHYMYPEPGNIFPIWKSAFVKRVTFPTGKQHLVGCGIYNMKMDKAFIEDVVERAAALVAERGQQAFPALRDKAGPFVFMDTYVFVDLPDGTELVNPAQPSLEGKNVMGLEDAKGKAVAREYIEMAMTAGRGWVEYNWYKPGHNTLARKQAYVRKVQHGAQTYVVGSGVYLD